MELIRRRLFSTTARQQFNRAHYDSLKPSLATPAPTSHGPVLSSPELEQLAAKAKGSWKEFTKEEAVQLYRATFPKTFKEIRAGSGHYKIVLPAVIAGVVAGIGLAQFLKTTVGPKPPHTFNNPEWDAAIVETHLKNRANPITGISSKYSKHYKGD